MNSNIFWKKKRHNIYEFKNNPAIFITSNLIKKKKPYLNLVHLPLSYLWIEVYLTKTFYEHLRRIYTIKKTRHISNMAGFFSLFFSIKIWRETRQIWPENKHYPQINFVVLTNKKKKLSKL